MRQPSISVIVPTFNRVQFLGACLDSLLGQTVPAAEIIVVNDSSTDGTESLLERYGPRVTVHRCGGLGRPSAINVGLQHVSGDYIWIFDDDDVAEPMALERLVAPLERSPEYGFSYCQMYYTRNDPATNTLGEAYWVLPIPDVTRRGFFIELLENQFIGGAALFARRGVYDRVGLFNPELIRTQDYEMAIRIAREFRGVRVDGPPLFHYRQHLYPRGKAGAQFPESDKWQKWFNYDLITFKTLYRTLRLDEYLPPGFSLNDHERQALVQRLGIMATKTLIDECREDLRLLSAHPHQGPLNRMERSILRWIALRDPYYGVDHVRFRPDLFEEIGRLSGRSRLIRRMRGQVAIGLAAHAVRTKTLEQLHLVTDQLRAMYLSRAGSAQTEEPRPLDRGGAEPRRRYRSS